MGCSVHSKLRALPGDASGQTCLLGTFPHILTECPPLYCPAFAKSQPWSKLASTHTDVYSYTFTAKERYLHCKQHPCFSPHNASLGLGAGTLRIGAPVNSPMERKWKETTTTPLWVWTTGIGALRRLPPSHLLQGVWDVISRGLCPSKSLSFSLCADFLMNNRIKELNVFRTCNISRPGGTLILSSLYGEDNSCLPASAGESPVDSWRILKNSTELRPQRWGDTHGHEPLLQASFNSFTERMSQWTAVSSKLLLSVSKLQSDLLLFLLLCFHAKGSFFFPFQYCSFPGALKEKRRGKSISWEICCASRPVAFSTRALSGVDRVGLPPHTDLPRLCRSLDLLGSSDTPALHPSRGSDVRRFFFTVFAPLKNSTFWWFLQHVFFVGSTLLKRRGLPATRSLLLF